MSYLKRVTQRREQDRATEERRKRDAFLAGERGPEGYQHFHSRAMGEKASTVYKIPKPPPANPRCGKWLFKDIFFAGRCGLKRGHDEGCVRRENVVRVLPAKGGVS